ncbi:extracellular solute-binding protein [Eubacteriales bacterium OttesenSCG-928-A19]|nr:extracellular solute-binding protein [Eubacteriales bacterium OttesenSCG-928-A19]
MRKWMSLLLVLAMMLSVTSALATVEPPENTRIAPEGETIEFSIFQRLAPQTTELSADKNKATKIIEDATGLKLNFTTTPQADAKTKINLLMNSGDYPEIVSYRDSDAMDRAAMDQYAQQGILVALDEYITPEIAPNIYKIFEENPAAKTVCTGSDGMIYALPDINECYHCTYGNGRAWYYMPWMRDINDDVMPATTEELREYLQYIKDNDVNGNGDPNDEIPLAFNSTLDNGLNRFAVWVSNFFMVYPKDHYLVDDDGVIKAAFAQPGYKDALQYANELYEAGLILPDAFSITEEELRTLGEDPNGPRIGLLIGWGPEDGVAKAGTTLRWYEFFPLSPVEGPTGHRNHDNTGQWGSVMPGYFITDKCENVEAAVRLADLIMGYYYSYTVYLGPKGEMWDDPTEGAIGFNGEPAEFRELVAYGTQETNCSWDQASISNRPASFRMSQEAEGADTIYEYLNGNYDLLQAVSELGSYNEIMKYYGCEKNLAPYAFDEKYVVPSLLYSDEMADLVADANASVDAYRKEMLAAFVTGARPIEEFDQYVAELESMGLNDILDARNEAYQATLQ